MKVLAINGSPRKEGNTSIMINWALEAIAQEGLSVETVQVGGQLIHGCKACGACARTQDMRCIQKDDLINDLIPKVAEADGLILGSPVYFADLTPELKAFMDRVGFVSLFNQSFMRRKVGAAAVVARRAGQVHTFDSINHFFGILEMFTVGSSYWNLGVGVDKGDVLQDAEGEKTMRTMGANMAWLLKKIHA